MRWGVVSTISEPAPLVLAFASHYAGLGAERIDIYLDVPEEELARALRLIAGCVVHQKRNWSWPSSGLMGPPSPPKRQALNAQRCYDQSDLDWLLHVDADEFLIDEEPLLDSMKNAARDVMYLATTPRERVWLVGEKNLGVFDGVYRHQCADKNVTSEIYGAAARFLDWGLSSNGQAKSFCRVGEGLRMGVHQPRGSDGQPVRGTTADRPHILHFDGLTESHFLAKLDRRISQEVGWRHFPAAGRLEQMKALDAAGADPIARSELANTVKRITPSQAEALDSYGMLTEMNFNPDPALTRMLPSLSVDLSCKYFDSLPLRELPLNSISRGWNGLRSRTYRLRQRLRLVQRTDAH